jgi:hypothetical protein
MRCAALKGKHMTFKLRRAKFFACVAAAALLSGCNTIDPPLIFGKMDTFGLSASMTAPDQGGTVTLGYRSAKLAIVPVTAHNAAGGVQVLTEQRNGAANSGAFSTFAHFEASAAAVPGVKACLGDTFATGIAAQAIAERLERVCK